MMKPRRQVSFHILWAALLTFIIVGGNVFLILTSPLFFPRYFSIPLRAKQALCASYVKEALDQQATNLPNTSVCTDEYQPVCGEVQVQCIKAPCPPIQQNYPNRCFALQAGATIVGTGICHKPVGQDNDLLKVTSPTPDQKVSSPLVVKGEAVGSWYFEAEFPVLVTDESGKQLGVGSARTQGDWMSTNLVPFTAKVSFKKGTAKKGYVVLQRSNPSGLPENDQAVKIPVSF
jgi:hypothetical protein